MDTVQLYGSSLFDGCEQLECCMNGKPEMLLNNNNNREKCMVAKDKIVSSDPQTAVQRVNSTKKKRVCIGMYSCWKFA